MAPLLSVRNLHTVFYTSDGVTPAVRGVSFDIEPGETLGVVGESGCGKSVTAFSVMRLIPDPPGKIEAGEVYFEGQDLLRKTPEEMRQIRGSKMSMIFQEPMTSLNPVYTIGDQISEVLEHHMGMTRQEGMEKAVRLLQSVGIPEPERRIKQYPHEMSGGMRQRVMIAMALACDPTLLIADEPTTALDVTIQAQILELMKDLKKRTGTAIMLITHDLGVVAEMADRVAVMYLGKIIEEGTAGDIFHRPLHPYTLGLLNSIPRMDRVLARLHVIPGIVPNPMFMPEGCPFNNRCDYATAECRENEPEMSVVTETHKVSCFHPVSAKGQVI